MRAGIANQMRGIENGASLCVQAARQCVESYESKGTVFYKSHPIIFGILLVMLVAPAVFFLLLRYPPFGEILWNYRAWIMFGVYTATIFTILAKYYRPNRRRVDFWTVFLCLLALHIALFCIAVKYIGGVAPWQYTIYGPLWVAVLALLLEGGLRVFGRINI